MKTIIYAKPDNNIFKSSLVFDCDGVLLDSTHRYRTYYCNVKNKQVLDLEHWRANEQHCEKDSLLPTSGVYKRALKNPKVYVIIATARKMNKLDFDVIEKKLGLPNAIIYRGKNYNESGAIMKAKALEPILNSLNLPPQKVKVFEDNHDYLKAICDFVGIGCKGIYIPSKQGH